LEPSRGRDSRLCSRNSTWANIVHAAARGLRVRPNGSVEAKALWQKTARAREDAAHSFVLGAPRVELVRTIMNECAQTMWLRGRHDGFGRCLALPISAG